MLQSYCHQICSKQRQRTSICCCTRAVLNNVAVGQYFSTIMYLLCDKTCGWLRVVFLRQHFQYFHLYKYIIGLYEFPGGALKFQKLRDKNGKNHNASCSIEKCLILKYSANCIKMLQSKLFRQFKMFVRPVPRCDCMNACCVKCITARATGVSCTVPKSPLVYVNSIL